MFFDGFFAKEIGIQGIFFLSFAIFAFFEIFFSYLNFQIT